MPKRKLIVDHSEILHFLEGKGYSWNKMCIETDFLRPTDGASISCIWNKEAFEDILKESEAWVQNQK